MELETVVSLSRAEILRELIIEKLTAAAQQIFAGVEKTVAAYEEEASGFRQEIDRQRRQLEVVLQPEIKVETTDEQLFPICELAQGEAAGGGLERSEEEEQHKYEPSVGFICYTEEQTGEDDGEEEVEEHHTELDYESPLGFEDTFPAFSQNLLPPTVQSDRWTAGRRWVMKSRNHINLRIRILEDSNIKSLSVNVYKKYPMHELQCPWGLQEEDFLNLLRSTYPQLAADKPFEMLLTNKTRKLLPLKVNALTPEKIYETIKAAGNSALYIQLKEQEEPQATDEQLHTSQRREAAADSVNISDETRPHTSYFNQSSTVVDEQLLSPGVQPLNRKRYKQPQTHVDLRIRVLEDSQIDVLTMEVFNKYPLHELQCPCGLQEEEFLNLLRSTYPQLAADKPFDMFITNKNRKLKPLKANMLTPEEIYKTIRSAGNSTLYIRLKAQEEPQATGEEFHPSQRREAAADDSLYIPDQTRPHTGVQPPKRKRSRLPTSERKTHINLKICVLEDSKIDMLNVSVYKKYPVHELQCPWDLQEEDFLNLLRSTYPQLVADKPFDMFITDKSRKLLPLKVKTLTPEKIYKTIKSTGSGNSALYIQLKDQEEPQATDEEFHPSQRKEAAHDFPSILDQTRPHTGLLLPRVQPPKKKRSSEQQTHIDLTIRVLEDSQIDVLTTSVFQKYPAKKLRFPCGLQESDFLNQLKFTFPQLAAEKSFDIFRTDQHRKLQPLKVNTLTPEEIYRTIRSTGVSALYIRLKPPEELQHTKKHVLQQQKKHAAAAAAAVSPSATNKTRLKSRVLKKRKQVVLRFRLLEDPHVDVVTNDVLHKYPLQKLRCPRDLPEVDFLDLLKSTFPQLAADKPFAMFSMRRSRRLCPLTVNPLTPEEIYNIVKSHNVPAVYIQLKEHEEPQFSVENLCQRKDDAKYFPSTSDETRLHSSVPVQPKDDDVAAEAEEAEDDNPESASLWSLQSLLLSESEKDGNEASDRDDAHLINGESEKTAKLQRVKHSNVKTKRSEQIQSTDNSKATLSCKVCRVQRASAKLLTKHAWNHVNDAVRLCGVCGEGSESAEELRSHLQSHLKTQSCNICGKSFLSRTGFKGHIARHKEKTTCKTCHKSFTDNSALTNHKCVHAAHKLHKCDICQEECVSKMRLKLHMATHADKKPHSCSTCRKPFRKLEALSQHIASQSCRPEVRQKVRTYNCEICNRHFYTSKKLKLHMMNHTRESQYTCTKCNKQFPGKMHLMIHMSVHTGQKPYKCSFV